MTKQNLTELQQEIQALAVQWESWGLWHEPDEPRDSMEFMLTEIGEATDARIRVQNQTYTRNNPDNGVTWAEVDFEVADAVIMALRYFNRRGVNAADTLPSRHHFSNLTTERDIIEQMAIDLGRAMDARTTTALCDETARWQGVDGHIGAVVAAGLRYFKVRGGDLIDTARSKLRRMHDKKARSAR